MQTLLNSTEVIDFGMFTDKGNIAVKAIVDYAIAAKLSWKETYDALYKLARADYEAFGEATDTMVREIVYDAINANGEDFYV
jgi:hypothetical protein